MKSLFNIVMVTLFMGKSGLNRIADIKDMGVKLEN